MQKVQFNYEVWKNHPEREKILLVTRNEGPVTYFTDEFVGKISGSEQLCGVHDCEFIDWDTNGNFLRNGSESGLDLFMILPEENEMYVPVVKVPADLHGGTKILMLAHTKTKEQSDAIGQALGVGAWEFLGTYKLVKQ